MPASPAFRKTMEKSTVISVRGLEKRYGDVHAVRGIDFEVYAGEVFGLLGPNGAGKTTTVEILEGLRPRTAGEVRVLGYDPDVQVRQLKDSIGVSLQATNLPDKITVAEAIELFTSFYTKHADTGQLLRRLQLEEKKNAQYRTLSGGQKQRLALALALVNEPKILFLDEPTTGLDPQVRLEIHSLITELKDARRTILLTTHYIEEAERLCDRVAIVDEGKIVVMGTPRDLQQQVLGHSVVEISTVEPIPEDDLPPVLSDGNATIVNGRRTAKVTCEKPARTVADLLRWMEQRNLELSDIHIKRPTLEDVFIQLTGKSLRD
jgi:ABC-2 type transport system ATP-binding protein